VVVSYAREDTSLAEPFVTWLEAEWGQVSVLAWRTASDATGAGSPDRSIKASDLLVCLVTDNWLNSVDCGEHLILAEFHGKQIMTVTLEDLVPSTDKDLPEETEASAHRRDTIRRLSETHPAFHAGGIVMSRSAA